MSGAYPLLKLQNEIFSGKFHIFGACQSDNFALWAPTILNLYFLKKKLLLLIGGAKNLPYGITIEMSKQQKQHKIKICYFHQLLQWESPNVRKRSVKEHLLKKKNIFFQTSNELPLPPRPQPVFLLLQNPIE